MQLPRIEHLITIAVAVASVGLALPDGGFPPTAVAVAALVVWTLVVLGLATGAFPRSEPPRAALVAGLCLAGFAGLVALSMAWASDDGSAFEDAIKALAYLGAFVLVVVASPRESAHAWLRGIAIGLGLIGAIALAARFQPSLFGNPDAELVQTIPAIVGRLTYPVGYWNGLAALMAAAVVLLGWFAATGRSRPARALSAAALPVTVLALWMTGSRGGIVAALIALAILLVTVPARSRLVANLVLGSLGGLALILAVEARDELLSDPVAPAAAGQGDEMLAISLLVTAAVFAARFVLDAPLSRIRVSRATGAAALGALAVAAVIGLVIVNPVEQLNEFKQPPSEEQLADGEAGLFRGGGSGRWQFWETAVDAFASAPVEGVGAGDFTPYWLEHREDPIIAKRAHSLLFEALAELGIVGFALIVGFFATCAIAGVQRLRAGLQPELGPALAVLVVGFAAASVDWTWDVPAVFVPTVIAAAILVGPASLPGPGQAPSIYGEVRSRRRFARGVALLLVAWISICASGLLLLSDHALTSSRSQAAAGDIAGAIEAANDAIDLEPWAAEPRAQLAVLYEAAGDLPAARVAIEQAIARDRQNWELYAAAARLAQLANDGDDADANLARAMQLNPLDPRLDPQ